MYRFKYLILDLTIVITSLLVSFLLVFPDFLERQNLDIYLAYFIIFFIINLIVNLIMKNYESIYKFFSYSDVVYLIANIIFCNLVFYVIIFFIDRLNFIPRYFIVLNIFLNTSGVFFVRLLGYTRNNQSLKRETSQNILIIGTLDECNLYIKLKDFLKENELILGIIVKNQDVDKGNLRGFSILGNIKNLEKIIPTLDSKISKIILLSDLDYKEIDFLYRKHLNKYNIIKKNISGNVVLGEKNINIEDLLGRKKIKIFNENLKEIFYKKTILVTGAAGSIGKEIVKQLLNYNVKKIICVDNSEFNIFNLNQEIEEHSSYQKCIIKLADIKNKDKIKKIINEHNPNVIFHAAAIKHVSLAEENPHFTLETNLIGTKNILDSIENIKNFQSFILISTDKAVNPTSFMGLTKYLCERYVQNYENFTNFNLSFIRFGNVLSSAGSVVPIFEKRIKEKKDLVITNEQVERYFMLPEEAVSLVLEAFKISNDNKAKFASFILNMGEPIKILALAKKMLVLNNLKEGYDINIKITGLKKGEKLKEELFYLLEKPKNLNNNDILHLEIIKNYESFHSDISSLIEKYNNLSSDELIKECYSIFKKQKIN